MASAIYKQTDEQGNVYFSNNPSPQAEKIELPAPTITAPESPPPASKEPTSSEQELLSPPSASQLERTPYTKFQLSYPTQKLTFHNQRQISVTIDITPALREGDKIQLQVDGKPYGKPQAATEFTLEQLNRGEHHLFAQLIDEKDQVIQSTERITIYVHYAHLGT